MITPLLEKMIHEGIASSRTFVCGMSGSCVLNVPDNKYIVIHNMVYFPFLDCLEDANSEDYILSSSNKQVQLRSQQTDNHFIFRDSGLKTFQPIILDTYLVHNSNVAISFLKQPKIVAADILYQVAKVSDTILAAPAGYGGKSVVTRINVNPPVGQYVPARSDNTGVVPAATYQDEFKIAYTDDSILFDPTVFSPQAENIQRSLPILNIQYVLINKHKTDTIQLSS